MTFEAALGIINNAAFLVTLVVLYSVIPLRIKPRNRGGEVILGVVLGLTGIALMLNSWSLGHGIFFDTRSILLSTAGLFFGALPAGIAVVITSAFRIVKGGDGVLMGVAVIITAAAWGVLWRRRRFSQTSGFGWLEFWRLGLAVHLTMLGCVLLLPASDRWSTLKGIGPLILGIYPVATMLMGKLLDSQRTRHVAFEETFRNERWLRRLFEQAWGITALVDSEGTTIYASDSVGPILGYSPKEITNRPFDSFVHPDDRNEVRRRFDQLVESANAADTIEYRIRHHDGRWLWVETVATNLTQDPDIRAVVFNTRDTSDRKSREKIHGAVLEGTLEGFFATSIDTRFLEVNGAFCRMVGYTPEELASMSVSDIEAIESPERVLERRDHLLETGGARFESKLRHKDGSLIDVEVSVTHSDVERGRFFVFVREVTERKRVVSALIRQRQRLSNIIEGTDVGTWEWNIQSGEVVPDDRWAEMLGYSLEELGPLSIETWEGLVHPEDLDRVKETLDRHLKGRLEAFESDYRIQHKEGSWVWITDRGKVLEWDEHGRPLLMFGMHTDITERKRSDLEQQLLLDLMEHSRNEICVFDLDSLHFTRVSRGAQESLGYALDELVCMTPVDLQSELSEQEYRQMLRPLVDGERNTVRYRTTHRRKSGTSYPVETHFSYHPENRLFLAVTIDITEREAAQAELQRVQERYRRLAENAPDLIYRYQFGSEPGFEYLSPAVEAITGYLPEDFYSDPDLLDRIVHPDDLHRLGAMEAGTDVNGTPVVLRLIGKDGTITWTENRSVPVFDDNGELIGLEGIVRDITLWHSAEEALSAERNLLKSITEASPIGIAVVDVDGRITFANEITESLIGCGEGELLGRRYAELDWGLTALDGTPLPVAERPITRVLATGAPVSGVRLQIKAPGSGARVLSVSVTPLKDREGQMTGVLVLSEDISEQVRIQQAHQQMELELRQAQKMEAIGRLAGGVAHDFNNMLAVILGVTEIALADMDPESQLGRDLQEIDRAAQRSVELTRQLLAFSRKQVIQPQSVNLNELIQNRKAMLTRMIGEEISVDFKSAHDLWDTWIDPSQVDQILANLLVNARDAIDGVGTVTVQTANCRLDDADSREDLPVREGQFVRLAVSDSGAGIKPSDFEHIFEPFFTTKGEGEGTGLGLSTVYGIVKQNGGLIRVYSEPGKGASFEIYLPRYRGDAEEDAKSPSRINVSGSDTVLIVEDEEVLLKLARRYLEKHGYRVLVAHTPLEAIGLAHEYEGEIDLLLTDVVMPGMNGRQLDLRLREIRPQLKTVYMSGYTADVIARRGILEPGIEFIQKPFAMETLAEQVRNVLDGRGKTGTTRFSD